MFALLLAPCPALRNWTQGVDHYDPILNQSFIKCFIVELDHNNDRDAVTILYLLGIDPPNVTNPFSYSVR
jgi:hypothetical protein